MFRLFGLLTSILADTGYHVQALWFTYFNISRHWLSCLGSLVYLLQYQPTLAIMFRLFGLLTPILADTGYHVQALWFTYSNISRHWLSCLGSLVYLLQYQPTLAIMFRLFGLLTSILADTGYHVQALWITYSNISRHWLSCLGSLVYLLQYQPTLAIMFRLFGLLTPILADTGYHVQALWFTYSNISRHWLSCLGSLVYLLQYQPTLTIMFRLFGLLTPILADTGYHVQALWFTYSNISRHWLSCLGSLVYLLQYQPTLAIMFRLFGLLTSILADTGYHVQALWFTYSNISRHWLSCLGSLVYLLQYQPTLAIMFRLFGLLTPILADTGYHVQALWFTYSNISRHWLSCLGSLVYLLQYQPTLTIMFRLFGLLTPILADTGYHVQALWFTYSNISRHWLSCLGSLVYLLQYQPTLTIMFRLFGLLTPILADTGYHVQALWFMFDSSRFAVMFQTVVYDLLQYQSTLAIMFRLFGLLTPILADTGYHVQALWFTYSNISRHWLSCLGSLVYLLQYQPTLAILFRLFGLLTPILADTGYHVQALWFTYSNISPHWLSCLGPLVCLLQYQPTLAIMFRLFGLLTPILADTGYHVQALWFTYSNISRHWLSCLGSLVYLLQYQPTLAIMFRLFGLLTSILADTGYHVQALWFTYFNISRHWLSCLGSLVYLLQYQPTLAIMFRLFGLLTPILADTG